MGLKYRVLDGESERLLLEQVALEGERVAFAAECELRRLEAIRPATKQEKQDLAEVLSAARQKAGDERARAHRLRRNSPVTNTQIGDIRRQFLDHWIGGLEREHSQQTALLAGDDPESEQAVARQGVLSRLESAHRTAVKELAYLRQSDRGPSKAARPRPAKRAPKQASSRRSPRKTPVKRRRKT